jgi:hypothetical protein
MRRNVSPAKCARRKPLCLPKHGFLQHHGEAFLKQGAETNCGSSTGGRRKPTSILQSINASLWKPKAISRTSISTPGNRRRYSFTTRLTIPPVPWRCPGVRSPSARAHLPSGLHGLRDMPQDHPGLAQEAPSGIGEKYSPGISLQQPHSHFSFEVMNLSIQRRLSNFQSSRRSRKARFFCHRDEIVEMP